MFLEYKNIYTSNILYHIMQDDTLSKKYLKKTYSRSISLSGEDHEWLGKNPKVNLSEINRELIGAMKKLTKNHPDIDTDFVKSLILKGLKSI